MGIKWYSIYIPGKYYQAIFLIKKMKRVFFNFICFILLNWMIPVIGYPSSGSPLATGNIYKLAVNKRGIYKIDYQFLSSMGINPTIINPAEIKIYGQPGGMLPQQNSINIPKLTEQHIFISGDDDGSFDSNDYILFYADGPDWHYFDSTYQIFRVEKNLYSRQNFYFLKIEGEPGKRIQDQNIADQEVPEIESFDNYQHHETEQLNLLSSGRNWLGESFSDKTTRNVDFYVEDLNTGKEVKLLASVASLARKEATFNYNLNGQLLGEITTPALNSNIYGEKAAWAEKLFSASSIEPTNELRFSINLDLPDPSEYGHLDYLTINYQQKLNFRGKQLAFRSTESTQHFFSKYKIVTTVPLHVWDISNTGKPELITLTSNSEGVEFVAFSAFLKTYIAFEPEQAPTPEKMGQVTNQNLQSSNVPDLLIVTNEHFSAEAERLANHRQTYDGLEVSVVTTDQVYNEFSSGRQDVTAIRNFTRWLYLKNPQKLKYLLLFGDASFDYLTPNEEGNTNFVPTYQSKNSSHNIFSHASDDYFGFMDINEGSWPENNQNSGLQHDLEIGVGRIPVTSLQEAKLVVDKLIRYDQPTSMGNWRTKMTFVADDGDQNKHQLRSDFLADFIEKKIPATVPEKLYIDAYPQDEVAGSKIALAGRQRLSKVVEEGTLIVDYIGHGGETAWASESLLILNTIFKWKNHNKLPLFITATCEFGRFDDYRRQSGAELAILQPGGGAVALFTTTRPVFANTNFDLSFGFYKSLAEQKYKRLGDLFKVTKNVSVQGVVNRNFTLLGDPSQALALPELEAKILSIDDKPVVGPQALSSFQSVKISGQIENHGELYSNFNGELRITMYDEPVNRETLGDGNNQPMEFKSRENILFKGLTQVVDGQFTYEFLMPETGEMTQPGKLLIYASDRRGNQDAKGFIEFTSGKPCTSCTDNQPPEIEILLDDENFRPGNTVSNEPVLIVNLKDQSGINIEPVEGHNLVLYLDKDTIVLNDFYEPVLDNSKKGKIIFELPMLTKGKHSLKVAASDIFYNRTIAETSFNTDASQIDNIISFTYGPNPTDGEVDFVFNLRDPEFLISSKLLIFSSKGQFMDQLNKSITTNADEEISLNLELNEIKGSPLFSGIYIFHIILYNSNNELIGKRRGKLVVKR